MSVLDHPTPHAGSLDPADTESVRALWQANRRWVAAIILAHKPREAEVEDLLQEVAMRFVRNIHEIRDPAAVRPWLRSVAMNLARTAGRRTRLERAAFAASAPDPDLTPDGSVSEERREARERGARALELARTLPPEYREPLILRAVRGMSYRQIADILGVPITTIETRLCRARRMLRDEMEREDQAPVAGRIGESNSKQEGGS